MNQNLSPSQKSILYVEEHEKTRTHCLQLFQKLDWEVHVAQNDSLALEKITKMNFDLVLMNLMRPKTNGLFGHEVLKIIRNFYNEFHLPVLFLVEENQRERELELRQFGANTVLYLNEPPPLLLEKINYFLRLRQHLSHLQKPKEVSLEIFRIGDKVNERYEIQKKVGAGSFGDVYQAQDVLLDREVAIKIFRNPMEANSDEFALFERECEASIRIQHPNAVSVYDYGVVNQKIAFIAMELLKGQSLLQIMERRGRLSPQKILHLLLPICSVLSKAHSIGLIHRDIKTENIFIHRTQQSELVKLLDFGIARLVERQRMNQNLTMEELEFGTPAYMAPERFQNLPYDAKIDVYSLGVVFYEMLCGKLPFIPADNSAVGMAMLHLKEIPVSPSILFTDIPDEISNVVLSCLKKNAEERPSIDMLAQEIASLLGVEIDMYTYLLPNNHFVHGSFYDDLADLLKA